MSLHWMEEYRKQHPDRKASGDREGVWALRHRRDGFLTLHHTGTLTFARNDFLTFPDLRSAKCFRPDLQQHHDLEVVQLLRNGFRIYADIKSYTNKRSTNHAGLFSITGNEVVWTIAPYLGQMEFSEQRHAEILFNRLKLSKTKFTHRVPGYIADGNATKFILSADSFASERLYWLPPEYEIEDYSQRDRRVIDLDG